MLKATSDLTLLTSAIVRPLAARDATALLSWRYPPPCDLYNGVDNATNRTELLDTANPGYGVCTELGLIAFFCFGPPACVGAPPPADLYRPGPLDVGLGIRPDLTGRGLGGPMLKAGLAFAQDRFAPPSFRLTVAAFNRRAIVVYERAGFREIAAFTAPTSHGPREFLLMVAPLLSGLATAANADPGSRQPLGGIW